jgi:hypothetical protein
MLSEKESEFLAYWASNRQQQSRFITKILGGLPMAAIFMLPILLSMGVVYFYFPEWYTKVSNITTGTFFTIIIAVFIAILFFSYFRMHFKWEMNEQLYKELLQKKRKAEAANVV